MKFTLQRWFTYYQIIFNQIMKVYEPLLKLSS